jgi:hypothetical protein
MSSKLSALVTAGFVMVFLSVIAIAQDRALPEAPAAPRLPAAEAYSNDKLQHGLAATAGGADVIVCTQAPDGRTPLGGWVLSVTSANPTPAVWVYAGHGFPPYQVKFLGTAGAGINQFLYYQVVGWQCVMAVRNQAIGGTHDQYLFINGSAQPFFFGRGFASAAS